MAARFLFSIILVFIAGLSISAQKDTCNLELKFFEFNFEGNPENTSPALSQLDLEFRDLKKRDKESVLVESLTFLFTQKSGGQYKVKLKKDGYISREKKFEVDCQYADENDSFTVHIYLKRKGVKIISAANSKKAGKTEPAKDETANLRASIPLTVVIDIDGNVVSAKTESKTAFAKAAENAARRAKFSPTILGGTPVEVTGTIIYNFQ